MEEASCTEDLLTLPKERYANFEKVYKVLLEKKEIPAQSPSLDAPSSQTATSEEVKKIQKLLSHSREENVDLVE